MTKTVPLEATDEWVRELRHQLRGIANDISGNACAIINVVLRSAPSIKPDAGVQSVARAVWPVIGWDGTYDAAVEGARGSNGRYYQKELDYVHKIVSATIAAIPGSEEVGDWRRNCEILLAQIDYLEEATGEGPEGDDRVLVEGIRSALQGDGHG